MNIRVPYPGYVYTVASGSSLSAPQTAGLAAYLLRNPIHSTSLVAGQVSYGMKNLLRTLGRQFGPANPIAYLINNGIRDEFCGSGTKVTGREIVDLDETYHDRHILGSLGNESSPTLDHAIRTVFTEEGGKEGSSGGTVIPIPLSLNQSSVDDIFTLPTQNLAIARDVPNGFPNAKPQPTFFATDAGSISESAQQSSAAPQPTTSSSFSGLLNSAALSPAPSPTTTFSVSGLLDSAALSPPPPPTTTFPFSGLLDSSALSAHASPTRVGVQITDFNGLDVSLTFLESYPDIKDPQGNRSMLTLCDPSSFLAYLDSRKKLCGKMCLVRIEGSKLYSSMMMWMEESGKRLRGT